ncbi:hypothetical protein K9L67_05725 [Candidatus Woesearchaeota archaeon]|nr:hypothetical protein [Candidatus Woesearchaeota archaeon]MCF7901693.1 hypothetical protein [Candidatus Woesearchaeota archaeon]MCF8013267.1 hypothetical protein [Candidatus Woesearchaeota archaeon]
MGIFSFLQKKESKILHIEHSDIAINKQIFDLIAKLESQLTNVSNALKKSDVSEVSARLAELENVFIRIKTKVDSLIVDVETIMGIESQNRDFIMLNDGDYISDKLERLKTMSSVLDELVELISHHPGMSELKSDLLSYMYSRLNVLIDSINSVASDDSHMEFVYGHLSSF